MILSVNPSEDLRAELCSDVAKARGRTNKPGPGKGPVRASRALEIRAEIEAGTYETEAKIEATVDAILEALLWAPLIP